MASSQLPSAGRARRSTFDILYGMRCDAFTDEPPEPIPGQTEEDYTVEKLESGLKWAHWGISSRRVSPLSESVLLQYKAACKALLNGDYGPYTRRELIANVRTYEREISNHFILQPHGKNLDNTIVVKLSALREWKIIGRYGDYIAKACRDLKRASKVYNTDYWEQLCGDERYWTDISDDIRDEWDAWVAFINQEDESRDECQTIRAVLSACRYLHFSFQDMIKIIHQYAYRNKMVHSRIREFFDRGRFADAAKSLYLDLQDVNNIYGNDRSAEGELMKRIIEAEMKELFEIAGPDIDPEEPQTWKPKQSALDAKKKRHDQAMSDPSAYSNAIKKHNDRVSAAAADKVKREAEMVAAIKQLTDSGLFEAYEKSPYSTRSKFPSDMEDVEDVKRNEDDDVKRMKDDDVKRLKDLKALVHSYENTKKRAIGFQREHNVEDTLKYLSLDD